MEEIEKELKNLVENLNKEIDETTKELGKESLRYMKKQYSSNNLEGHIGNLELNAYNKRYKKGFILSSGNDEVAIYNEFGTGIVGEENPNPMAGSVGYKYNVNSPHKGVIPEAAYSQYPIEYLEAVNTPNTWWYFKNGKWWHTEGMKAKNMYSSLVDILKEVSTEKYKTVVSQVIGNYGGKK